MLPFIINYGVFLINIFLHLIPKKEQIKFNELLWFDMKN